MVTLRYLSTGMSFRALAFSFRMGNNTVGAIIKEVIIGYMGRAAAPSHASPYNGKAKGSGRRLPQCVELPPCCRVTRWQTCNVDRAIRIFTDIIMACVIKCIPRGQRKKYAPFWNKELQSLKKHRDEARDRTESTGLMSDCIELRKRQACLRKAIREAKRGTFRDFVEGLDFLLQALVDCNYKFLVIDVGGYGKQSDGGTFLASDLYTAIADGSIVLPQQDDLPDTNVEAPYVMLADEAYPLLPFMMTPFKRATLDDSTRVFNERLSRARKTVECAFGILFSKWRILSKPIETKVETADLIIKCICFLQNVIIDNEGFERHLTDVSINPNSAMLNQPGRLSNEAKAVRQLFTTYFEKFVLSYS
ncbi:hypothetical protein JTE90_028985 [Oedothorax gibbosus]|uniref:DDE Tnp4 domain-containing protein n=1 Tax=Oedothorax gibbosus TaxID=931172 RepID=A0AAV6VHT9_9ARAC|nr:hypothetical protein JTE90_028985 [Oedothorax gibbosus]